MRSIANALALTALTLSAVEHADVQGFQQAPALWGRVPVARGRAARPQTGLRLHASADLAAAYADANDGCWAGWQASFDAATGLRRPLPRKYLTDAMMDSIDEDDDWSKVPAGLELLTSEKAGARRFVLLYPEDG
jgi:hypothetical protein